MGYDVDDESQSMDVLLDKGDKRLQDEGNKKKIENSTSSSSSIEERQQGR